MRIAIIHPWFLALGGAEQTVICLAKSFPEADIVLLLAEDSSIPESLRSHKITVAGPNWLPLKYKIYRYLLFLYPSWSERLDLRGYDVVISSDSALMKGVITDQSAVHICYCHSPMRCLYDQYWEYLSSIPKLGRWFFRMTAQYCRTWDFAAAQRVGIFIANSRNVAQRIRTYYGRESEVVYPPVATKRGYLSSELGDYYLTTGRLTEAKRVDLLVRACNELGRKLVVVGSGRDEARLRRIAGPTVVFQGYVADDVLKSLYARCRAFLFAANEDFGIVPVEAQSFGRPVVAYKAGGSLETVIENITGVFFDSQAVAAVVDAILRFESIEKEFDPERIRQHAASFDEDLFAKKIGAIVEQAVNGSRSHSTPDPLIEMNN